jgi:hypothetical protein
MSRPDRHIRIGDRSPIVTSCQASAPRERFGFTDQEAEGGGSGSIGASSRQLARGALGLEVVAFDVLCGIREVTTGLRGRHPTLPLMIEFPTAATLPGTQVGW